MSYIGKGVETVTFNTATTLDVAGNITLGGTVDGRDVATDGTKLDTITSGAIADILQDTTPQLGGNLDLNTSDVIGTGNINVTGSITGTSFVSTGNMSFTNNSKAIFGTSPSLEIYHDGSNSILDDVGAGNFKMQLAGADKLEITSTGVDVTGTVTADGLTVQNVTVGVDGTYGGNYRTLGFSGNTNGSTRIFGTTDNSDNLYLAAGTGRGINFWVNGSSSTVMQVNSSGNVGINTTSPDYGKFTVQNTAGTGKVVLDNYQSVPTTENVMAIYADASNGYIESYNNGYKNIIIAGSGGNVGIGTSSPAFVTGSGLEIERSGAATLRLEDTGSGGKPLEIYSDDGEGYVINGVSTGMPMIFKNVNTERMRIDSSGNVNIGSAAIPASSGASGRYFDIYNLGTDATSFAIQRLITNNVAGTGTTSADIYKRKNGEFTIANNETDTAAYMRFIVGTQERMKITSSGNVGIGTSSISPYKLRVSDSATNSAVYQRLENTGTTGSNNTAQYQLATNSNQLLISINEQYNYSQISQAGNAINHYVDADNHIFRTKDGNYTTMTIDSSGRVTKQYQPMVSATRTSNFGTLGGNMALIPYNSATVNVGNHYNTSTGLFTCPVSGKYRVTAYGMNVSSSGDGTFYYNALQVQVAGSTQQGSAYNYGDGYVHMSGSWIVSASANDSIGIRTSSCLSGYGGMTIELIG